MAPSLRSLPPPSKKRKTAPAADSDGLAHIQKIETLITKGVETNGSLNPLADLLEAAHSAADAPTALKAIYALYRVFVTIVLSGKLAAGGDEAAKVVRTWIWERLNGYVELLSGLLKDKEKALRVRSPHSTALEPKNLTLCLQTSSLQILFSLLKHLSTSLTITSAPSTSKSPPQFHTSHFKQIVSALLICPPSLRSATTNSSKKTKVTAEATGDDGKLDADVRDLFVDTWFTVHDDIRWFFLREAACVSHLFFICPSLTRCGSCRTILATHPSKAHPHVTDNLLSILERLTTFPTDPAELNAWWVEELGARPPKPKTSKSGASEDASDDEDVTPAADAGADDDWRRYFDDPPAPAAGTTLAKAAGARLHKLTVHQSLHALGSHRAVFTRAWLALLPRLAEGGGAPARALAVRALGVMHRGVLPHLTRPVLVMDWVGASVDYGLCLLAFYPCTRLIAISQAGRLGCSR